MPTTHARPAPRSSGEGVLDRLAGPEVRRGPPSPPAPPMAADAGAPARPRTAGGVLLLPPWRRAPLLPFGQPAVLLAVIAAAAILACAAASAPLFLSSASSAALQRLLGQQCASAGTAAVKRNDDADRLAELNRRVPAAMTGAGLALPALSVLATNLYTVGAGTEVVQQPSSRLAYRAGAVDHITRLPGAVGGRGVWLPKYLGDRLGARPGGTVAVSGVPVRLAGYYRNFYDEQLPAFWCQYGYLVQASEELWTNGPAAPAEAAVRAQDQLLFDTIDQAQVFDAADYLGITWTFGYLTALAGLVGLVSVGALLLYVETRQRTRVAAYALGRRMGLSRATHLRSLLAELGLLLGLAYAVGVALSWVALELVHGLLDVDPIRPPTPLLVLPVAVLAGAAVAVAVVAALTARYAQRVADRTPPAETLRLGT